MQPPIEPGGHPRQHEIGHDGRQDDRGDRHPGDDGHGRQQLAQVTRTERRTGIEGWFDEPVAGEVSTPSTAGRTAPPRWKQATTIWLVFFPLSLLTTVTLGELLADLPVVARVAVTHGSTR